MGYLRAAVIFAGVSALAGPALAECPTASDLASGIRVVFANRSVVFRIGDPGVVAYVSEDDRGISCWGELAQGLFPLSGGSDDLTDVNWGRDYGRPATSIARPQPEQTFLADFVENSAWVTDDPGLERYVVGPLVVTTLGECELNTFSVTVSDPDRPGSTWGLLYSADLGFAVNTWSVAQNGVLRNDQPLRI